MSQLLTELNHQRFLERYEKKELSIMAVISIFMGHQTYNENFQKQMFLAKKLKAAKFDFIKYIGEEIEIHYPYEGFLIFCTEERKKDLIRFLLFFGKFFKLNSFVIVDETKKIWYYATRNKALLLGREVGYGKCLRKDVLYRNKYDIDKIIKEYSTMTYNLDNYVEFKKRI